MFEIKPPCPKANEADSPKKMPEKKKEYWEADPQNEEMRTLDGIRAGITKSRKDSHWNPPKTEPAPAGKKNEEPKAKAIAPKKPTEPKGTNPPPVLFGCPAENTKPPKAEERKTPVT